MVITNQKDIGELIAKRLQFTHPSYADKEKFAKKANIKVRMLYKIMKGANTKLDTILIILKAADMTLNVSKVQLSKKNGKPDSLSSLLKKRNKSDSLSSLLKKRNKK